MIEIEFCSELEYSIQTNCYDETDGWDSLKPFVESSTAFFKLLGCRIVFKEFWLHDEGQKFASNIVGYNITVTFYGQGSHITRYIGAASLFFEFNNAVKTKENLYFVPKDDHN